MVPNFFLWLLLVEHDLRPAEYDALFDRELEMMLLRITDPQQQEHIQTLLGRQWTNYIARALRNVGFREQLGLQEKIHDVVVKLLVAPGGLFRDYDEQRHGPFEARFRRSVANAVKNITEKDRNRRRLLPSVPIGQEFQPGMVMPDDLPDRRPHDDEEERLIAKFRHLVRSKLGELGLAVLDARLSGQETKSLVGRAELGKPGKFVVKRVVQQIKALAREFFESQGDQEMLRQVERAFEREAATVGKRLKTGAGRKVRG